MGRYLVIRILSAIPTLFVVSIAIFLILKLAPGDPAALLAGEFASPDVIERVRQDLGLNRSLLEQYLIWAERIISGDLGTSIFAKLPVTQLIAQRLEPTLLISALTLVIALPLGIALGSIAALRSGTRFDSGVMLGATAGFSLPVFVVGYALIYVFSVKFGWLPIQGYTPMSRGLWLSLRSILLPSVALSFTYIALIARITRAAMQDVLSQDYVRTARAAGAGPSRVLLRHALRNAGVPIVTVAGIGIALLISGVVVTETVFNIPGVGRLLGDAINRRDYPIVQGVVLFFAFVYVGINLLIDISYSIIDPRIRLTRAASR